MPPEIESPAPLPEPKPPLTGRKVFFYFLAFFLVFGTVDAFFVYFATSTNTGVVTDKAYEKGLAYNKVIEQAQAQHTLGWTHILSIKLDLDNKRRVVLRMRDKNNKPLTGGGAIIRFFRPVQDGIDFDVPLKERSPGTYIALAQFPMRGQWEAYIAVRVGDTTYRAQKRVILN